MVNQRGYSNGNNKASEHEKPWYKSQITPYLGYGLGFIAVGGIVLLLARKSFSGVKTVEIKMLANSDVIESTAEELSNIVESKNEKPVKNIDPDVKIQFDLLTAQLKKLQPFLRIASISKESEIFGTGYKTFNNLRNKTLIIYSDIDILFGIKKYKIPRYSKIEEMENLRMELNNLFSTEDNDIFAFDFEIMKGGEYLIEKTKICISKIDSFLNSLEEIESELETLNSIFMSNK